MLDRDDGPPRQREGGDDAAQIAAQQGDVRCGDRDIGAGPDRDAQIRLCQRRCAEPEQVLTTESLYTGISEEIGNLRRALPLAPGRRLRELNIGEQVIVSSDELIDHLNEPSAADFLRSPRLAPFTMIRGERVRSIKVDPLEWARYFQCYQVETWDRDLVLSVFVHVAVGEGALYVEWTPCILLPIKKKYQQIDQMSRSPMLPIGQSLLELIKLPASIPGKLAHTVSFIRPQPQERGSISPDTYGVSSSLRELAADTTVHNYFQLTDIERYVKMMESRLVLAVSRIMREAGYSPASFDQQAATVINNNVQIWRVGRRERGRRYGQPCVAWRDRQATDRHG